MAKTQQLYQLGGLSRGELAHVVQQQSGDVALLADGQSRFGAYRHDPPPNAEVVIHADSTGITGLLENHRVNIGKIEWLGSMRDDEGTPDDTSLYPHNIPLTAKQVALLKNEQSTLYRIGGISRPDLNNLIDKLRREGINGEVVKVAGNRFDGSSPEFTVKTTNAGILGLLSDHPDGIKVGVC
jgi:hypothetical protein